MLDIVSLGELLIDFTPAGKSAQGNALYECNPGGGVANMAVAASMCGGRCAFIGKVGNDTFGRLLRDVLEQKGVVTGGLRLTDEYLTTVAFVHLFENGDRDFTFYRQNGADANLTPEDVDYALIDEARLMHVSSLTMTRDSAMEATLSAFRYARKKGLVTTYDPNWRPLLWNSERQCHDRMKMPVSDAHIVKCSEEELAYIMDEADETKAAHRMLDMGPQLLIVTRGAQGSSYYCAKGRGDIPAYPVQAVDTTGAGDCFLGNAVMSLLRWDFDVENIEISILKESLRFASAAAAMCALSTGAMPAMPSRERVEAFMKQYASV